MMEVSVWPQIHKTAPLHVLFIHLTTKLYILGCNSPVDALMSSFTAKGFAAPWWSKWFFRGFSTLKRSKFIRWQWNNWNIFYHENKSHVESWHIIYIYIGDCSQKIKFPGLEKPMSAFHSDSYTNSKKEAPPFVLKAKLQNLQTYGRTSVCVRMCFFSMLGFLQRMPHSSQMYFPRPRPRT